MRSSITNVDGIIIIYNVEIQTFSYSKNNYE
jgi:hypothetical protein